ncbi:MAG: reverse transcriptase family protein [Victivallaceae bacterium]|nr:reverse transcriptase family protein [Victivallaceae bacterium]
MDTSNYIINKIPKRDGSLRMIAEPEPALKRQQKRILRWLEQRGIKAGKYAHGFVPGRSIATHAACHVGKRVIVKVDIHDFFGNTTEYMLRQALRDEKLPTETIDEILHLCLLNRVLPQGAPTSPLLSNLALKRTDGRLAGLAEKYDATYSRYADDLCFSSNNPLLNQILPAVDRIIRESSYQLNRAKTRVIRRSKRQIITGCVVNRELGVPRELRRNLRAQLHNLKQGLIRSGSLDEEALLQAKGMSSYFHAVKPALAIRFRQSIKEIETLQSVLNLRYHHMPGIRRDRGNKDISF